MKKILIEWKYYAKNGGTCLRCSGTRTNLSSALKELKEDLIKKDIHLEFKETVLPESKIPQSNIILIDGVPIEELLPDTARGENKCCSCSNICGKPTNCRTLNQRDLVFEEIPTRLIKEAVFKKLNLINNKGE